MCSQTEGQPSCFAKMSFALAVALLCFSASTVSASAGSGPDSALKVLNATSFKQVLESNDFWMVEFYTPSCTECEKITPELEQAAKELKNYAHFAVVDASIENNKKIVQQFNVQGVPTLLTFSTEPKRNPYTNKMFREHEVYSGAWQAKNLVAFATKSMPSFVDRLDEINFRKLLKDKKASESSIVILFTARSKTSAMYKALSARYKNRGLRFVEIHKSETSLVTEHGIEKFPSVLVIKRSADEENAEFIKYGEDSLSFDGLLRFVDKFQVKETIAPPQPHQELKEEDFEKKVLGGSSGWVVLFQRKEGTQFNTAAQPWRRLSAQIENTGVLHAGVVDCQKSPKLCKRAGSINIGVFEYTDDKSRQFESMESAGSLEEAFEKLLDSLPDATSQITQVRQLDSFLSRAAMTRKVVLVHMRKTHTPTPLVLKAAAVQLQDKAEIVVLNGADDQSAKALGVPSIPSLILMFSPETENGENRQFQSAMLDMTEDLPQVKVDALVATVTTVYQQAYKSGEDVSDALASDEPIGEIPYLMASNFEKECSGKALCAIALLEGYKGMQNEKLDQQVELLKKIAQNRKKHGDPYSFTWTDGVCHQSLLEAFRVEPTSLPTLVVFSSKKKMAIRMKEVLTEENGESFLRGALLGKEPVSKLKQDIIMEDIECSKILRPGLNDEIAPLEQEEDLSDLMAEILAEEENAKKAMELQLQREAEEREKQKAEADAKDKKKKKKRKKKKKKKDREEL